MIGKGEQQGDVLDQAIGWHLRLPTAARADWIAFTEWLEAAPAHQAAYDAVTLDDALLSPTIEEAVAPVPPVAANDGLPQRRWLGVATVAGGMAAAAAFALFGGTDGTGDGRYSVETTGTGRKQIAFSDGSRILLNGGSRVTLDRANPRFAALERGEAMFLIRHDAARPFQVTSGALALRDLGTAFNVARDGERLGVQVAEGAVQFDSPGQALTLRPGVTLSVNERSRKIELARVGAETVGGWRFGRQTFSAAPLASVAAAIGRAAGGSVTVVPALADVPFTGTIAIRGGADRMVPKLAALSGTNWRREGQHWTLYPRGR